MRRKRTAHGALVDRSSKEFWRLPAQVSQDLFLTVPHRVEQTCVVVDGSLQFWIRPVSGSAELDKDFHLSSHEWLGLPHPLRGFQQ